jgi:hypothetical protein
MEFVVEETAVQAVMAAIVALAAMAAPAMMILARECCYRRQQTDGWKR